MPKMSTRQSAGTSKKEGKPGFNGYEVTTFRIDGEYLDGRHPKEVIFTPSLHEDLARRDFTINAMAVGLDGQIIDDFGGLEDLEGSVIRAVGDPIKRFTEDALRMLRAIRFAARLGFRIEENTYNAIRTLAPNLQKVSKERIEAELTKLLLLTIPKTCSSFSIQVSRLILQKTFMVSLLPIGILQSCRRKCMKKKWISV